MTENTKNLLAALAQYVRINHDAQLDAFLTGYAGEDWAGQGVGRMNTITITKQPDQAAGPGAMFNAPDNENVAHELFLFLAENLQPGFVVELAANGRSITQPSGSGRGGSHDHDPD